jgi:hypothetical protein
MTVITILPVFVRVSEDVLWIYHLINLIPVKMFDFSNIISIFSIDLLGIIMQPYELFISFSIVVSIILLPLAYRSFKNHN